MSLTAPIATPLSSPPSDSSVPPTSTPAAPPPLTLSPPPSSTAAPPPTESPPSSPPSPAAPPPSPTAPPPSPTAPPPESLSPPPPPVVSSPPSPPPLLESPPSLVVSSPPSNSPPLASPPESSSPPAQPTPTPPSPPPTEVITPSPPTSPASGSSPPPSQSPPPPKSKGSPPPPPPPPDEASPPKVTPTPPTSKSDSPPPSDAVPPPPPPPTSKQSPPIGELSPPSPPLSAPNAASPPPPPKDAPKSSSPSSSPSTGNVKENPNSTSTQNTTSISVDTPSKSSGKLNTDAVAVVGIVIGFVLLTLVIFGVWIARRRRRREQTQESGYAVPSPFASSQNSESLFLRVKSGLPSGGSPPGSGIGYSSSNSGGFNQSKSSFTYEELIHATNGFSMNNLLGEGGFGCVYKGILTDGREVAVKQLKIGGNQGEREFRAEVEIIGRIHHRHLVSLVGYCISEHQRLLVYDYVPNNTLHYHLHGDGLPVMDWATRVKVAAGAARGLAYLHEDCHPRIIHRDIKSSNILLDSNFEARVSDFGLAKLAQELDSNTHVSTRVMGTFGYLAPEYATSGKLTEKSDVYSFGVVLLEIITGRKPVDASQPMGEESLVEWARPLLSDALDREAFDPLTDPRLERNYVASEMFRMIEAAAACVRHSAARRPRMSQVARVLDSLNELADLSNGMKPGQSEIFNSRDQSAQIRIFQRLAFGSQDLSSDFFDQTHSWTSRVS